MSNIPYSDLGECSGESGDGRKVQFADDETDGKVSEDDKLNDAGDIGISDNRVYASYQKSGGKGRDQLKTQYDDQEDMVNINSSLKSRNKTSFLWLRHPQVRENWKTVAGAIFLLIAGISFLICGIVLSTLPNHDGPKAFIFFVCAAVCILPGGYHTVYIYRATKGWRGYTFQSLPSFR